jgi:ubiquinone/menaquinone biosynthesis C-methylase UbiE
VSKVVKRIMNKKNLDFFEAITPERDKWKKKNSYYWGDVEKLCSFLIPENASVLEIGSGTGDLLACIKARKKVGIDYSRNMIGVAKRKYPDINFMVMEAEDLNFEEKFDYVILSNLIGYLEDIQKVFAELKKVCHPHSKIIVTYYNFLWQPVLNIAVMLNLRMKQPKQNWLSKQDIKNLLYLAGFDAFKEGERLLLPINIPLVSEIFNRYLAKLPLLRKLCITNYVIAKYTDTYKFYSE